MFKNRSERCVITKKKTKFRWQNVSIDFLVEEIVQINYERKEQT